MGLSVNRGKHFGGDPNARCRHAGHRFNNEGVWVDRKEVRIKRVVVCGAERQAIAPVVRAVVCFSANVRSDRPSPVDREEANLTHPATEWWRSARMLLR